MLSGNRAIYAISLAYTVGISGFMLWHRSWFSPDQFFAFAIIAAVFVGRLRLFLSDWIPFLLLFFSYEYLHGFVPLINKNVHVTWMINADRAIFGFVPTIKLQQTLLQPNTVHWYDILASTLYIAHFIVPMVAGYLFWLTDRKIFKEYTTALIVLSFAAFITYIIFPAMPPWMASEKGYLPPLSKIMDASMANFGHPLVLPTIYQVFRGDEVAAVPSLHAAYPFLIFLFALKKFKKYGLILAPYVIGVWFAVIYLGEHYFIDVLLGAVYAFGAYTLIAKRQLVAKVLAGMTINFLRAGAYAFEFISSSKKSAS